MDGEVGQEGKGVGHRHVAVAKSRRGDLDDVEGGDGPPLVIGEEGVGGAEPGAEGRGDFERIRRNRGELAVVDRELVLKLSEVP